MDNSSRLPGRFWLFLTGQTVSELGSAFTAFALPLLVFRLTGSSVDLAAATAVAYLPWVCFGLLGGALVDRVDRRRAMLLADAGRAVGIALVPLLALIGELSTGWIFAVLALQATLQIVFTAGWSTAVVALVPSDLLATANGRLSAGSSAADVAGASLAGLLATVLALPDLMWVDAASFVVSAVSLGWVRSSFNETPPVGLRGHGLLRSLLADTKQGLAYVWRTPALRVISTQLTVVNLFGSAATAEFVLEASRRLGADNSEIGYLAAVGGIGVIAVSLVIGPIRRRLRLSTMTTLALLIYGAGVAGLGLVTSYPAGLVLRAAIGGATVLFNVATSTLRQQIVPNQLLGRATNVAIVFSWCAIPVGSLAGGWLLAHGTGIAPLFVTVGAMVAALGLVGGRALRRAAPDTR